MRRLSQELFTPYRKKSAFALLENAERFVKRFGLERVGFLTLTFPDNVTDHHEAYRRFCNMRKCLLSVLFGEYLLVKERQVRGAWHFHLLVQVHRDIRTAFNFRQVFPSKGSGKRPRYTSASLYLRNIWQTLRNELPKYGFGRSELAPIRETGEAMARYVGKYLEANIMTSIEEGQNTTKGVRLTSASKGWPVSSPKFAWNTANGKEWREKVSALARALGITDAKGFRERFGERWAYFFAQLFADGLDPRDMVPHNHKIDEHGAVVPDPRRAAWDLMAEFHERRKAHRKAVALVRKAGSSPALSSGYVREVVERNSWIDIPDEQIPF